MKVIHAFKAKKVTFRDKNLQKVKNDPKMLHLAFVLATQIKTHFYLHKPETLRKPTVSLTFC